MAQPTSRIVAGRGSGPSTHRAFHRSVRDALAHLNDLAYLQTHALVGTISAEGANARLGSGTALRDTLLHTIESLRPDTRTATGSPAHRRYQILLQRYVEGRDSKSIQAKLGIGRSEYYREHQGAVLAVVTLLRQGALDFSPTPLLRMIDETDASGRGESGLPRHRTALPRPLSTLIGRDAEAAAAKQLLATERLVTLTGAPGAGKTRLALELAHDLGGEFADGVYFVPLASIVDPALVVPAIAQAVDVGTDIGGTVEESLARSLEAAHSLLVLDNFEQIVEAGPLIATLLQRCPQLHALVTSRTPL